MTDKEMNSYRFGYNVEPTDEMLALFSLFVPQNATPPDYLCNHIS